MCIECFAIPTKWIQLGIVAPSWILDEVFENLNLKVCGVFDMLAVRYIYHMIGLE